MLRQLLPHLFRFHAAARRGVASGGVADLPIYIQPENMISYARFESCLREAVASDLRGYDAEHRSDIAHRSVRRMLRALERVETRRAAGEDVGLATSLYSTRDLPGSVLQTADVDGVTASSGPRKSSAL